MLANENELLLYSILKYLSLLKALPQFALQTFHLSIHRKGVLRRTRAEFKMWNHIQCSTAIYHH